MGDSSCTESELYHAVYSGGLGINEGMVMENAVAQAFVANGRKLFFYSRYDLENAADRMEIDFLIRRGDALCPVEVKSGREWAKHSSLDKFRAKFGDRLGESFILHTKDLQVKDGIGHLPIYMAMFVPL